ncbi:MULTISPECIES: type II secretion system minor pseudopilin GspI [unclassified Pseudomonas]|uniref:type II secretion system minor pseudopilin GspI n=1 Tax=unclassified Pseudomonas TaxID=196821 RepID=UPI000DA76D9F|nr:MULTISPECIES: type II secretion system minor pseudopilin GspI [unclassified Pseudomonas]MDW3715725.1 type II secretion system minor pseudopilin GspI [Pseudomonas sp. 2023EL-01195]PZE11689.1 type II secretion system protein GspI [Pseudomonas sp. 57B-090624]
MSKAHATPRPAAGFTLIEVLVALAIVAVAMSAAVRAAGQMTQADGLLRDRSIALLAAQSRLAELRLEGLPGVGRKVLECDQGRLRLSCEQRVTPLGDLVQLSLRVYDRERGGPPLARLETLVARDRLQVTP